MPNRVQRDRPQRDPATRKLDVAGRDGAVPRHRRRQRDRLCRVRRVRARLQDRCRQLLDALDDRRRGARRVRRIALVDRRDRVRPRPKDRGRKRRQMRSVQRAAPDHGRAVQKLHRPGHIGALRRHVRRKRHRRVEARRVHIRAQRRRRWVHRKRLPAHADQRRRIARVRRQRHRADSRIPQHRRRKRHAQRTRHPRRQRSRQHARRRRGIERRVREHRRAQRQRGVSVILQLLKLRSRSAVHPDRRVLERRQASIHLPNPIVEQIAEVQVSFAVVEDRIRPIDLRLVGVAAVARKLLVPVARHGREQPRRRRHLAYPVAARVRDVEVSRLVHRHARRQRQLGLQRRDARPLKVRSAARHGRDRHPAWIDLSQQRVVHVGDVQAAVRPKIDPHRRVERRAQRRSAVAPQIPAYTVPANARDDAGL